MNFFAPRHITPVEQTMLGKKRLLGSLAGRQTPPTWLLL
jgi:hypothetical protein